MRSARAIASKLYGLFCTLAIIAPYMTEELLREFVKVMARLMGLGKSEIFRAPKSKKPR